MLQLILKLVYNFVPWSHGWWLIAGVSNQGKEDHGLDKWKDGWIDVTVERGVAGGISDHFLVECKVKRFVRKKYVNWGEFLEK